MENGINTKESKTSKIKDIKNKEMKNEPSS
jgi:hypothetical protein